MFNVKNLFHQTRPQNKYLTIPLHKVEQNDCRALMEELAVEITRLRKEYCLSHEVLSHLSGMTEKNCINMEKGGYLGTIRLDNFIKYLAAFNCKIRLEIVGRNK